MKNVYSLFRFVFLAGMLHASLFSYDMFDVVNTRNTMRGHTQLYSHPLYWQALLAVAHGKKDVALQIINAMRAGQHDFQTLAKTEADAVFDKLLVASVAGSPQYLTQLGLFESIGICDHNALLNDMTPDAAIAGLHQAKQNLALLESLDREKLTADQQVSYDILHWGLAHEVAGEQFLFHDYRINQMFGALSNLTSLMMMYHPLANGQDVAHYLSRLSGIEQYLDDTISYLAYQRERGINLPAFAIKKVINLISHMMPQNCEQHFFYTRLAQAVRSIPEINSKEVLQKASRMLLQSVYPALERLRNYFEQCAQVVTTNHGVWALPEGDAYYQYLLSYHMTTNMTPDEIHELGIREVQSIQREIRDIFASQGISDVSKSVGELLADLAKDARFYFEQSEQGKRDCLAGFESIIARSRAQLYRFFNTAPKQPVIVQAVPVAEQEGKPAAYYARPGMDGVRPGIFFVNLRDMHEMPKYRMETLAVHEAEPGHHFQISLQQTYDFPLLRKLGSYTAYVEGWALYVEKLAYEHDFYSDAFSCIGHLADELLRAVRLVVDTGIHAKRWTREQAIDYMVEITGAHRAMITTEVERYFVYPGQACSYKIGQLTLLALRERMRSMLGDAFDIKIFHDLVLNLGAAPLTVVEEVIATYVSGRAARFHS